MLIEGSGVHRADVRGGLYCEVFCVSCGLVKVAEVNRFELFVQQWLRCSDREDFVFQYL